VSQGQVHTFSSLLEDVDFVEIPIIQRDYAQGRTLAADVRNAFLSSLRNALQPESPALDLDFVYGNVAQEETRYFSVLDGQQRLTTLFLLHWYLAVRDGQMKDFRELWISPADGRSRFSYATRPSAAEFFQALVHHDQEELPTRPKALSTALLDARWFFDAWRNDPTVSSCLVMLDAIHETFGEDAKGQYSLLVKDRKVTFHFLNLRDFGLSDDLYIKMNSRGKPLTAFENFKAWLVDRVGDAPWANDFALGMDQRWLDFFWDLSGRASASQSGEVGYDELFLRFFYLQAYFEGCEAFDERPWASTHNRSWSARPWLARIRDARGYTALNDFEKAKVLGPDSIAGSMRVLEFLCSSAGDRFRPMLVRALAHKANYDEQLYLHALSVFLRSEPMTAFNEPDFSICLARWLRVTSNLIGNSRVDELSLAISMVKGLAEIAAHAADLYPRLAERTLIPRGFSKDQTIEECRKAALILQDPEWEADLIDAESHWYLQGRIGFLLDLSLEGAQIVDRKVFRSYSATMKRVITPELLDSSTHLLPRALLSLYDYLPTSSNGNHTLCVSKSTTYRDRLENWLPVFQDQRFGMLLDSVGEGEMEALQSLIKNSKAGGWRGALVNYPALIDYCSLRMVRKQGPDILLISKLRRTSYFTEAESYALFQELRTRQLAKVLPNLKAIAYQAVYGDDWPELRVHLDKEYWITYSNQTWRCRVADGEVTEIPGDVLRVIEEMAGNVALT